MTQKINIAIVGVGNCASALIQGLAYYRAKKLQAESSLEQTDSQEPVGLMHEVLGGYTAADIEVVAAFDIDQRKVGQDVAIAIFAPPNCTTQFYPDVASTGVSVSMGCILDGVSEHLESYPEANRLVKSDRPEPSKQQGCGYPQSFKYRHSHQLPTGWFAAGYLLLRGLCSSRRHWFYQLHSRIYR